MKNPRQLVQAAFDALRGHDYSRLASLCDPLSLQAFKQEMVDEYCPAFSVTDDPHPYSRVELTDEEYARLIEFLDPVRRLQSEFPSLTTIGQLLSMDTVALFATWMYANSAERFQDEMLRKPWETSDWALREQEENRNREPNYVIIGCVFDTPDIAHVLYHNELSALEALPEAYGEWLASASPVYREFMTAMHHRGLPILITCRRQPDASWRLVARKHFMLFGSFAVTPASGENET